MSKDTSLTINNAGIANYMSSLLSEYNYLRHQPSRGSLDFWDVVVLTSSNEEQKLAYELMIQNRLSSNNPLPSFVEYVVIADPPGCKVGNGGSTLHVLYELKRKYGERLFSLRVMLLHCGGQSQRLPCTSILGKIFAPLPLGQPLFDFFDIKLCNYIPFVKNMNPGVFVVPSDDIQPFCLKDKFLPDGCVFNRSGFTVLAHPSTLEIGTKHGVFVLSTNDFPDEFASVVTVQRVLQKPTILDMRSANAVLTRNNLGEFCYSDSCFYFCHGVSQKLLQFYKNLMPLNCEIDAYGDFLQCLGSSSTPSYVTDERNVSDVSSTLRETRLHVYNILHNEPISALVLPHSIYIHFGTMPEYIDNLVDPDYVVSQAHSGNPGLRHFFEPFRSNALSLSIVDSYVHSRFSCGVSACIMRSVIGPNVHIDSPCCVVEYSVLTAKLVIDCECIVSHCFWRHKAHDNLHIPSGLFLYTVALRDGGYSTIAFGVYDDLKYFSTFHELKYYNGKVKLSDIASAHEIPSSEGNLNLWNAKLFTIHKTPDEAFAVTVHFINRVLKLGSDNHQHHHVSEDLETLPKSRNDFFSVAELLSAKDIAEVIKLRQMTVL